MAMAVFQLRFQDHTARRCGYGVCQTAREEMVHGHGVHELHEKRAVGLRDAATDRTQAVLEHIEHDAQDPQGNGAT